LQHQRRSDDSEEKQRWANDGSEKACGQSGGWTRSRQETQGRQENNENLSTTFPVARAAALSVAVAATGPSPHTPG